MKEFSYVRYINEIALIAKPIEIIEHKNMNNKLIYKGVNRFL